MGILHVPVEVAFLGELFWAEGAGEGSGACVGAEVIS